MIINGIKERTIIPYQNRLISEPKSDMVAEECPVALVYNGISHVVMMATPNDLNYFAYGFSLSEGIIDEPNQIFGIDCVKTTLGIEVHIELSNRQFSKLKEHRRMLDGRTGCGVCGREQLSQLFNRQIPHLSNQHFFDLNVLTNIDDHFSNVQPIGTKTGCTHAAMWFNIDGQFIAGFEDIGRHIALDKLLGYRATQTNQQGAIVVSSRASYEMVQKTIMCGAEILISISAATSLAIEIANKHNLTLVSFFKNNRAVIYSGDARLMINR